MKKFIVFIAIALVLSSCEDFMGELDQRMAENGWIAVEVTEYGKRDIQICTRSSFEDGKKYPTKPLTLKQYDEAYFHPTRKMWFFPYNSSLAGNNDYVVAYPITIKAECTDRNEPYGIQNISLDGEETVEFNANIAGATGTQITL